MKLAFLFLCFTSLSIAQKSGGKKFHNDAVFEFYGDTIINDTFFMERVIRKDSYHAVFIETNRDSQFHNRLMDFSMDQEESFAYGLERIKESGQKISQFDRKELPSNWLPLCSYNGKLYIEAPADWGSAGRMIISDSLFINWGSMDGPDPVPLANVEKNGETWHISQQLYELPEQQSYQPADLYIRFIDSEKGIALWEYRQDNESFYSLYVDAGKAKNFDAIVNYCETEKWSEFQTDEIDYNLFLPKKLTD